MKLISKIICTSGSSMAIVYGKEWASWPFFNLFKFRFDYIQNNRNPIFIIISDNTLMGIGWITTDYTVLLASKFSWVIRRNITVDLVLFHFHILLLLLHSHNKSSVGYQLIMTFRLLKWFLTLFLGLAWTLSLYFVMTWSWRLWMTWFFPLGSATLRLRASCTAVGSSTLFLSIVLRILILATRSVLRSSRFVSHSWASSKSIHTLRLLGTWLGRRVVSVL